MTAPPWFMCDPPTEVRTVSLDGITGETTFTVDFVTPASRSSLYLYRPAVGSESAILHELCRSYGIPFFFSVCFLFLGAGLTLLSQAFRSYSLRGRRLLYPGLAALASGLWQFSENALTVYLSQTPTVLYVLAFAGMFLLTVPIIKLTMISLDRTSSPLLLGLLTCLRIAIPVAFALQLAGVVQLCQSSLLFSVALPAIIVTLAAYSAHTYRQTRDEHVLRYTIAISLIAAGAVLELLNYYLRIITMVSLVFQVFLLAFVVVTAVEAVGFFKRVYRESLQKLELDRDIQMLEQSIDAQKQRNEMLLSHEREVRRLRHDLRHHYVYLSTLVQEGRYDELEDYVNGLGDSAAALEQAPRTYCENLLANALVSHYADLAYQRGYAFNALLDIPADMPHLSDADLCVVLGNLLENALEACARIPQDSPTKPVIDFKARTQGALLFITLDNSLGAAPKRSERGFETSKSSGSHGIGLQSIQAIAQKYDGEATFSAEDNMFHSSLYLTM